LTLISPEFLTPSAFTFLIRSFFSLASLTYLSYYHAPLLLDSARLSRLPYSLSLLSPRGVICFFFELVLTAFPRSRAFQFTRSRITHLLLSLRRFTFGPARPDEQAERAGFFALQHSSPWWLLTSPEIFAPWFDHARRISFFAFVDRAVSAGRWSWLFPFRPYFKAYPFPPSFFCILLSPSC